jgi:hypothetical protein
MAATVWMIGLSGSQYSYEICAFSSDWAKAPGNYAFAFVNAQRLWQILYVGQADDFSSRMRNHERWPEALRLGATHVLAHVNRLGESTRLTEERDLIHAYNPPMNVQHRAA